MRQGGFFFELKRRRVWRVAGAYVLVVWMAVEIILETAPVLGLPAWLPRVAVLLAFLGFPITLVLSWVYDLTSTGVVRTPSLEGDRADDGTGAPPVPGVVRPRAGGREQARLAGVFGAGIVVALVGFGAYSAFRPAPVRPEAIEALAVMPFSDLSPGGDQGYFADGVTEELINRLGRVGELRVAGRTSTFALHREGAGLAQITRELGVDAVVEGSVRRSGDRLRVSVELVDAASGFQLWSETYDRTVDDFFDIQDDISTAIVAALRLQLVPGASRRRAGTENLRAHDDYLLGLSHWHARTEADLLQALDYFQSAADTDPSYAAAHAGLALTYAVLPWYADIPADVAVDRGLEAAGRALALDAQNAEAHAAVGQIAQALEWNLESAAMAYRRALEFQPSFATGHQWYAETLLLSGRLAEARHEIEEALRLDPRSVAARFIQGYVHVARRDYDSADRAFQRLLADNPGFALAHTARVELCLARGCDPDDALDHSVGAGYPAQVVPAVRAVLAAAGTGDGEGEGVGVGARALAALDEAGHGLTPARRALLRAALGDGPGALADLEYAYEEGVDPHLLLALVHPLFDPIRRDPRFMALTEALGIEVPGGAAATAP